MSISIIPGSFFKILSIIEAYAKKKLYVVKFNFVKI